MFLHANGDGVSVANPEDWADLAMYLNLGLNIIQPVAAPKSYWEELSTEQAAKYRADIVFQSTRVGAFNLDELATHPTLGTLPAVKAVRWRPGTRTSSKAIRARRRARDDDQGAGERPGRDRVDAGLSSMLYRPARWSMVFGWQAMPTSSRRMLVRVAVVVVPDGADIAGIGFKKEPRHRVDPGRLGATDRAHLCVSGLLHRALTVKDGPARWAVVLVRRHSLTSRSTPIWSSSRLI